MSKDPPGMVDEEGSEVVVDPNEDEVALLPAVVPPVEVPLVAELLVEVVQLPLVAAVLPQCAVVPPEVVLPLPHPSPLAMTTTTAVPAVEEVHPATTMATAAGEDMKSQATTDRETDSITVEEAVPTAVEDRVLVHHTMNTAATIITVKAGAATATMLGQ